MLPRLDPLLNQDQDWSPAAKGASEDAGAAASRPQPQSSTVSSAGRLLSAPGAWSRTTWSHWSRLQELEREHSLQEHVVPRVGGAELRGCDSSS